MEVHSIEEMELDNEMNEERLNEMTEEQRKWIVCLSEFAVLDYRRLRPIFQKQIIF